MIARAVQASELEVFQQLKIDLHLRPSTFDGEVESTVAAVIRRLSGFMCPCPKTALASAAVRSLRLDPETTAEIADQVDGSIEDLMIAGDLIELSKVVAVGAEDHLTWLFCAPPSFVKRADGRIYVFGVGPDDAVFLPGEILAQVHHLGATRYIDAPNAASLADVLPGLGLRQINEAAWLIPHQAEAPEKFLARMTKRLQQAGIKGHLPEISILRHATDVMSTYRQRWAKPQDETGIFVGRHPRPYGAPLWYLCEFQAGEVQRSLLLPLPDQAARACDVAWQTQLAIDAVRGYPALMRSRADPDGEGVYLNVQFPLPMAARRRLVLLGGRRGRGDPSGFSFWLPTSQLAQEVSFLKDHFWYVSQRNSEGIQ
ncbi:hypothetical protein [Variovorax sp. MHTC-1]|uniref:hypothetical protein n=1 Tax=Variovorax sp. MHTC-1 TaxID=2495593 RepID=UPI000F89677C|nr:hypothetical protein [Variovorax sp. MHTC-1]RST52633.1 hypothetical protein EJI01_15600 [Variovorax sp. MHTC-1]